MIDSNITIGELLAMDENVVPILMDAGMHCIGCPSAQAESIGEAALVHGIDPDQLVSALNEYFASKKD